MKTQKRTGCYRTRILRACPDEQQPGSGEQNALEEQLQKKVILWSPSEFWDKTEFKIFLTISKTKELKSIALSACHRKRAIHYPFVKGKIILSSNNLECYHGQDLHMAQN